MNPPSKQATGQLNQVTELPTQKTIDPFTNQPSNKIKKTTNQPINPPAN
jgi:hypothetical protein